MISRASDKNNKETVLNSLYYLRMQDRRGWISEAHAKTFNWALEGKTRGPTPLVRLEEVPQARRWHILAERQGRLRKIYPHEVH
jgi:hypothetical protein